MGYTFSKHMTVEANIAVAHGISFFQAYTSERIGAQAQIHCRTRGKMGIVSVEAKPKTVGGPVSDCFYVVDFTGGYKQHATAEDAMQHFVALVGPVNARKTLESACKDRSAGGTNHCTIEAEFEKTETALFAKSFLTGRWCFTVRLGYTRGCYAGGCCIYKTFPEALEGWNRSQARAAS